MEIISRAQAKARGLKRYFTGKPCKRGHIAERLVTGGCMECDRLRLAAERDADPEKARAYWQGWSERNRESVNASALAWKKENPHRVREHQSARRAQELRAMPPWADREAIAVVYAEADRLTRETGIPHHVDHIVPLKHPRVCGLHVPANLRVIPASENLRKSNRWWPEISPAAYAGLAQPA